MFFKSLKISEMRCFRHAEAEFQYPGRETSTPIKYPNINLLLGNNGMGKTATLKAAALAALSPIIDSAGYVPYSIVRKDRRKKTPITEITVDLLLHQCPDLWIRRALWRSGDSQRRGVFLGLLRC